MCDDAEQDLTVDTNRTLVDSCSNQNKCEYICDDNYTKEGDECVLGNPNPSPPPPSPVKCDMSAVCDKGDITFTHGGKTFTMKACNVGAGVAGTGVASYGCLFQWGNNHGFPGNGDLSSTITNAIDKRNGIGIGSVPGPSLTDRAIFRSQRAEGTIYTNLW